MLTRREAGFEKCMFFRPTRSSSQYFSEHSCRTSRCPRWKDEKVFDKPCKEYPCKETINLHGNNVPCNGKYLWVMDKEKHYLECCLNCEKHFGRCGG